MQKNLRSEAQVSNKNLEFCQSPLESNLFISSSPMISKSRKNKKDINLPEIDSNNGFVVNRTPVKADRNTDTHKANKLNQIFADTELCQTPLTDEKIVFEEVENYDGML